MSPRGASAGERAAPATWIERAKRDPWIPVAFSLLAAELALLIYIGSRGGGPGPVKAYLFGPTVLMGVALFTGVFGIVWSVKHPPFTRGGRMLALLALSFVFLSSGYPYPFPAAREGRPSKVEFQLPVEGEWTAAWGGDDTTENLLARSLPARRFALCLVRQGAEGTTTRSAAELGAEAEATADAGGAAAEPGSHLAFGVAVVAPAAGEVAAVVDRFEDGAVDSLGDELGNRVVLEVAEGEFLVIANLAQGSIEVAEGQRIEAGAPLGRVGSSARSRFLPEPHLALHLQDSADPLYAQGIPWFLHGIDLDGKPRERAMPRGGGRSSKGEREYGGQRVRRSD